MTPDTSTVPNVVAIDGPAASGKSTVARRLARHFGYLYVDSGALYRGVTWAALERDVPGTDTAGVLAVMGALQIEFGVEDGAVTYTIDGVRPGAALRTEVVNRNVSPVAAIPEVRAQVVRWLRDMAALGPLVMEGRDIGTRVFPASPHKFYLDADPEVRARRRLGEMAEAGDVAQVGESLRRRDRIDSGRQVDPLRVAPDAMVLDSTALSIDEVVAAIRERITAGSVAG